MKRIAALILTMLLSSSCNESPKNTLTAEQIVQNRLKLKQQATNTPAAILNQYVRETQIISPLAQAGELYAQQVQKLAPVIEQTLQESWGTELQSKQVNFNGQTISYQYQLWKIKPQSVCSHTRHEITAFSKCTVAAKDLFHELCNKLQTQNNTLNSRTRKLKTMYCQTAAKFKPTIAQISRPQVLSKEKQLLRQKCNDAIVRAMIADDDETHKGRNNACRL